MVLLRSRGIEVRHPLLKYLLTLNDEAKELVRMPLTAWLDAELFLTGMLGSTQAFGYLEAVNHVTRGASVADAFRRLQVSMGYYLGGLDQTAADAGRKAGWLQRLDDEEFADPAGWYQEDRNRFLVREFAVPTIGAPAETNFAGLPGIFESAGLAAELWGDDGDLRTLDATRDWSYIWPLVRTAYPGTWSNAQTIATHLALCDLALAAPILPVHVDVRAGLRLPELMPHLRLPALQELLVDVGPLAGPDEYQDFTEHLCSRLGWVPPRLVFGERTVPVPALELGIHGLLYDQAAALRALDPAIFIVPFLSYDPSVPATIRGTFEFHTIQYADRVTYHGNKDWLYASQVGYVVNQWLHGIMSGTQTPVRLPWHADRDETEWLRDEARGVLSQTLGWDVPPPHLTTSARTVAGS
jgi:hypothetical protein